MQQTYLNTKSGFGQAAAKTNQYNFTQRIINRTINKLTLWNDLKHSTASFTCVGVLVQLENYSPWTMDSADWRKATGKEGKTVEVRG
jgi:hypothetical protein